MNGGGAGGGHLHGHGYNDVYGIASKVGEVFKEMDIRGDGEVCWEDFSAVSTSTENIAPALYHPGYPRLHTPHRIQHAVVTFEKAKWYPRGVSSCVAYGSIFPVHYMQGGETAA